MESTSGSFWGLGAPDYPHFYITAEIAPGSPVKVPTYTRERERSQLAPGSSAFRRSVLCYLIQSLSEFFPRHFVPSPGDNVLADHESASILVYFCSVVLYT